MTADSQSKYSPERRVPRVRALHAVHVSRHGEREESRISAGRTLDVSPLGVRVEVLGRVRVDDEVQLAIAVDEGIILAQGRVVYATPTGARLVETGIEFTSITEADREALAVA